MDLAIDIWIQIMIHMKDDKTKTALKCNIINKNSNLAFKNMLNGKNSAIYPKRTFIETRRCMNCEQYGETKCISYATDMHPRRNILYCDRFGCLIASLQRYLNDMNVEKKYPFISFPDQLIWIPRSNGGYSSGKVLCRSGYKLDKDYPCIDVTFTSEITTDVDEIPKKTDFNLVKTVRLHDIFRINSIFFEKTMDQKLFVNELIASMLSSLL